MHMAKVEELVAQAKALQKAMKEGKAGAGVSCLYIYRHSYSKDILSCTSTVEPLSKDYPKNPTDVVLKEGWSLAKHSFKYGMKEKA